MRSACADARPREPAAPGSDGALDGDRQLQRNADYRAGGYTFEVDIRPVGSSAAWVAYYDLAFTLSGCGAPGLTPDLASPEPPATTVHWTATVTCSGTPQYEFQVRSAAGVWS